MYSSLYMHLSTRVYLFLCFFLSMCYINLSSIFIAIYLPMCLSIVHLFIYNVYIHISIHISIIYHFYLHRTFCYAEFETLFLSLNAS